MVDECYSSMLNEAAVKEKIEKRTEINEETGCWEWQGAQTTDGYGQVRVDGEVRYCHRLSYEVYCNEIREGMQINHKCHNPPCCNPDHLYMGTQSDNIMDAVNAGRHKTSLGRGEDHIHSKLTVEEVKKIRGKYSNNEMSQRELAAKYGVAKGTIQRIVNHETWTDIE